LMFVSVHYSKQLPPELRENAFMVFVAFVNNENARKKIYEEFNTCFENRKEFERVFPWCTKDHRMMVLMNKFSGPDVAKFSLVRWDKVDSGSGSGFGSGSASAYSSGSSFASGSGSGSLFEPAFKLKYVCTPSGIVLGQKT
jgi:hypothetical protein